MSSTLPLSFRAARLVRRCLSRIDVRLLVALVSLCGLLAWVMPWQVTAVLLVPAAVIAFSAARLSREGKAALVAYGIFILVWSGFQNMLYLLERPGEFAAALQVSLSLGARLFTLLGLAMAVPLTATPVRLGRTLTWYLGWLVAIEKSLCAVVFRGKIRPRVAGGVWRAALALCLMMAFFPRSLRAMKALRTTMAMRAPHLAIHRRLLFMGLAILRVLSAQTWDMTLAIASRNLYRPEPWQWRK